MCHLPHSLGLAFQPPFDCRHDGDLTLTRGPSVSGHQQGFWGRTSGPPQAVGLWEAILPRPGAGQCCPPKRESFRLVPGESQAGRWSWGPPGPGPQPPHLPQDAPAATATGAKAVARSNVPLAPSRTQGRGPTAPSAGPGGQAPRGCPAGPWAPSTCGHMGASEPPRALQRMKAPLAQSPARRRRSAHPLQPSLLHTRPSTRPAPSPLSRGPRSYRRALSKHLLHTQPCFQSTEGGTWRKPRLWEEVAQAGRLHLTKAAFTERHLYTTFTPLMGVKHIDGVPVLLWPVAHCITLGHQLNPSVPRFLCL